MNIEEIRCFLPHRYPFLMIDKVTKFTPYKNLTAIKNITANEPHFNGHFPIKSIMPGVLIIEALAQATGILAMQSEYLKLTKEEISLAYSKNIYMLVGIDKVRFKQISIPGDQLKLSVEVITIKRGLWKFATKATVDDKLITNAELICTKRLA